MGPAAACGGCLPGTWVFERQRTDDRIGTSGIILYQLGLAPRDARLVLEAFVPRSYEEVRQWSARARGLFQVQPRDGQPWP